jgi:tRNA threonylcarbamoyladenosine biosynthesis protein TsaB
MALLLSLDSTTSVCSVAVHRDGELVDSKFIPEPRAASSQLLVEARALLGQNSISPASLSAIAVSSGPGSYTGLRIATSAAKGLCYALDLPLIAVNSLLVLSRPVVQAVRADLYCPMLDARRMEVYCVLINRNLELESRVEARVLDGSSFLDQLDRYTMAFFGDGSEKFKAVVNHPHAIFVDGVHPEAKQLGFLAFEKFLKKEFESLEDFEPFYLKDFMIKKKL